MEIFVGIVLLGEADTVYLIKENDRNEIGMDRWNLPGGSVDNNEGLVEAATREGEEETGFSIEVTSLLGCYKCKKKNHSWLYIVFEAKYLSKSGKPIDPDIKDGKWFTKENFLHLDSSQIVHPDMQLVYNMALEKKSLPLDSIKFIDYNTQ